MFIALPGKGRILDANIEVHRHRPVAGRGGAVPYGSSVKSSRVCYGLQARDPTKLFQEFTVSLDMEDPTFYSTCHDRPINANDWLPFPRIIKNGSFHFGENCIDCKSYIAANRNQNADEGKARHVTAWLPPARCKDCRMNKGENGSLGLDVRW